MSPHPDIIRLEAAFKEANKRADAARKRFSERLAIDEPLRIERNRRLRAFEADPSPANAETYRTVLHKLLLSETETAKADEERKVATAEALAAYEAYDAVRRLLAASEEVRAMGLDPVALIGAATKQTELG